eukprot:jgi/Botrbrau1/19065/Bobra.0795s0002.1
MGIGLGNGTADALVAGMSRAAKARLVRAKVLVVEEAAMMEADLADRIDAVLRKVRKSDQLGPVGHLKRLEDDTYEQGPIKYLFESRVWDELGFKVYCMLVSHRYPQGSKYWEVLTEIRDSEFVTGRLYDLLDERTESAVKEPCPEAGPGVFYLMNTRWEVEKFCKEKQRALDGEGGLFRAVDRGRKGRIYRREVGDVQEQREDDSDCYGNEWGAQQSCFKKSKGRMLLVLKKGDPVVAVSAVDEVPNGSVGWVRGFVRASLPSGRPTGRMGLDYRRCGIGEVAFVEDWKYVGSVGCEDASGVVDGAWPVVEFVVKGERVKKTVPPKLMTVEGADGEVVCCRFQVPLLLAYAFTVHRVQVPRSPVGFQVRQEWEALKQINERIAGMSRKADSPPTDNSYGLAENSVGSVITRFAQGHGRL